MDLGQEDQERNVEHDHGDTEDRRHSLAGWSPRDQVSESAQLLAALSFHFPDPPLRYLLASTQRRDGGSAKGSATNSPASRSDHREVMERPLVATLLAAIS